MPIDRRREREPAAAGNCAQHRARIGAGTHRKQRFVNGQRLGILDEHSRSAGGTGTGPDRVLPQIGPPDSRGVPSELQQRVEFHVGPRDPVIEIRHQLGFRDHGQLLERQAARPQPLVQVPVELRMAARVCHQGIEPMRGAAAYDLRTRKARQPQIGAVMQEAPGLGSECG